MRQCGDCTLCCRLLPVGSLKKKANEACRHLHSKGCRIYDMRPTDCQLWSCRWLTGESTENMPRPDRCGYVIDMMPDAVMVNDRGEKTLAEVVVVWASSETCWQNERFYEWVDRCATDGKAVLIRYDERRAQLVAGAAITVEKERVVMPVMDSALPAGTFRKMMMEQQA
jgi:hypothetical protein